MFQKTQVIGLNEPMRLPKQGDAANEMVETETETETPSQQLTEAETARFRERVQTNTEEYDQVRIAHMDDGVNVYMLIKEEEASDSDICNRHQTD